MLQGFHSSVKLKFKLKFNEEKTARPLRVWRQIVCSVSLSNTLSYFSVHLYLLMNSYDKEINVENIIIYGHVSVNIFTSWPVFVHQGEDHHQADRDGLSSCQWAIPKDGFLNSQGVRRQPYNGCAGKAFTERFLLSSVVMHSCFIQATSGERLYVAAPLYSNPLATCPRRTPPLALWYLGQVPGPHDPDKQKRMEGLIDLKNTKNSDLNGRNYNT